MGEKSRPLVEAALDHDWVYQNAPQTTADRHAALLTVTVAAVNGHAVAAGLVLALACDRRIGPDRNAHFGLTEVRAGIPFPAVAMAIVRAELAPAAARSLVLLGQRVDATSAAAFGLVGPADSSIRLRA